MGHNLHFALLKGRGESINIRVRGGGGRRLRCKDGTLREVVPEKIRDKRREEECVFDAGRGGEEERRETV